MPLTPFHWNVVLFGFLALSTFYIPALAISSVIMDLEPFYYLFISPSPDGSVHGFFHTYFGVTIIGLAVGFVLIKVRKKVDWLMSLFKIKQESISTAGIYLSSILAAWSHVFLDSFMHADLKPFWPLTDYNPFLGLVSPSFIYLLTGLGLVLAFLLYILTIFKK